MGKKNAGDTPSILNVGALLLKYINFLWYQH